MKSIYDNLISVKNDPRFKIYLGATGCTFNSTCPELFPIFSIDRYTEEGLGCHIWTECEKCDIAGEHKFILPHEKDSVIAVCNACEVPAMRITGILSRKFDMFLRKKYV